MPELQPLSEERLKQEIFNRSGLLSPRLTISNAIWTDVGSTIYMLDLQDQARASNNFGTETSTLVSVSDATLTGGDNGP